MDLKGRRVAVTGATGFIGRDLVRALRARGAEVVAVVRNPAKAAGLAVEVARADLADEDALVEAFRGAEAVYANAGLVSIGQHTLGTLRAVNVGGTLNTLRAMALAGVRRAVLTSSATVYAPRRDHLYAEDHRLRAEGDFVTPFGRYALSKAIAERAAWRAAADLGIDLTVVRPHQIHGPFDGVGFTHYTRMATRLPITVWPTRMELPSVYVEDLTEAMCRMLERPTAVGRAYNIAGAPDVSYWDLLQAWFEAGGPRPKLVLPLPIPIRRRFSIERAGRDLDFENRPLVEGFRALFAREAG